MTSATDLGTTIKFAREQSIRRSSSLLQFYYDYLDKYLDCSDFQMCEMDTDSAYTAISGESVESLVKPELRAEFDQDKCDWFPRTDTPEHKAYQ